MEFIGQRVLFRVFAALMLTPQMRKLDGRGSPSSSFFSPIIVVAFDVSLLSKTLNSLEENGGDRDSFDLVICLPYTGLSVDALENIIFDKVLNYRSVLSTCIDMPPPFSTDYNPVLYLMIPDNKSGIEVTLNEISKLYQVVRKRFYSTSIPKLSWIPMFLVVWPELRDHCQNDSTLEGLLRASISESERRGDKVYKTFTVNSDIYIYFGSGCVDLNVWEVYSVNTGFTNVQKLAKGGLKREWIFEGMLGRVARRLDLFGANIKAISSKDPSSFLEAPEGGILNPLEIVDGTPQVIFTELLQTLNFTVETILGDWLSRYPNGTLKGTTINLFRKGMADVTISVSSLLPYRKVELSYLQPTYSNSINGFFVQPSASSLRDIAIAPFSFWLWVSLFITLLILLSSILYFGRQYEKLGALADEDLPESDYTLRNELALWAVGALAQQGWHTYPKTNSTRIAFTLGYVMGLVCYGAFSGAVVSILAVEMIPINSREQLLNSSLVFYADNASSTMAYIVDFLRQHTNIAFGTRVNLEEGVSRLNGQEPSCYIAFPHYFYLSAAEININETWICSRLSVIPVTTSGTPSSMVVPRNSEFAELFNYMIIKMFSGGLNDRFVSVYNDVTTLKCSKTNKFFHPLGINDVFTACLILFGGIVSSAALLCLEKVRQQLSSRAWRRTLLAELSNWQTQ